MIRLHLRDRDRGAAAVTGTHPRPRRARGVAGLLATGLAVVVMPLALAVGITAATASPTPASARVVTAQELESDYGVRVDLVAVIAAGGLVNVRFTVVDADKAGHLLHDTAELPILYVESTGAVLRTSQPKAHKMTVLPGASYFLLYPNSGGAIQRGTQVSLVVDAVRTSPVGAQS